MITSKPAQLLLPPPCASYGYLAGEQLWEKILQRSDDDRLALLNELKAARTYYFRFPWWTHHENTYENIRFIEDQLHIRIILDWEEGVRIRREQKHYRKVRAAIRRAEARERKECAA